MTMENVEVQKATEIDAIEGVCANNLLLIMAVTSRISQTEHRLIGSDVLPPPDPQETTEPTQGGSLNRIRILMESQFNQLASIVAQLDRLDTLV